MSEQSTINNIQKWILQLLILSALISLFVGINMSPMEGYYVFTVLVALISLTLILINFEIFKSKLDLNSKKIAHALINIIGIIIFTSLFHNNLNFPLIPSLGLSVIFLLFVNWVYYTLEPLRG